MSLLAYLRRVQTDPPDQGPRERLFNQELRLLFLFKVPPVVGSDGFPIDLVQLRQVTAIWEMRGASIGEGKGPSPTLTASSRGCLEEIGFDMHDGLLSAAIGDPSRYGASPQTWSNTVKEAGTSAPSDER